MPERPSLSAHLRAALVAALLLALCQVALETPIIALRARQYILSPYVFFGTQMYDFCIKLFLLIPGADAWLQHGPIDHFLPVGFAPKLALAKSLLLPNLLVALLLGFFVGLGRWALRRPARVVGAAWTLIAIGLFVHLGSWLLAVHIPKGWNPRVVMRQAGRVFLWEGTVVALIAFVGVAALTSFATRLRGGVQWGVAVALLAVSCAAGWGLPALSPEPLVAAIHEADETPPATQRRAQNVILISIDSLRADRLGAYGNPRATSPTMDRLAREGVRFENATSTTSWTLPSHMSLLTGRDVLAHGVITEQDKLPDAVPTLAELLQQHGLQTGGIVSYTLLNRIYGFGRGFDSYDDHTIPSASWFDALKDEPAPQVTELATNYLRERKQAGKPFFLFLHFWDVHYDYIPPAPYDSMFDPDYKGTISGHGFFQDDAINRHLPERDKQHLLALYDGEIRWVDDHIGMIVSSLEELGLADDTAIIVTADHGDEFFEHGFKGHGRTLYREVVHVPMIMRVPGVAPGQVIDAPVSLADVTPTILDLVGAPGLLEVDGASLVPAMTGQTMEARDAVYSWLCFLKKKTNCQALQYSTTGALIHRFQPLQVEFYRPDDPAEQHDVAGKSDWPRDPQLDILGTHLNDDWMAHGRFGEGRGAVELDEATLEKLRQVGYKD